ncbi:MAG: class I SAM-dependent methyltransferase [Bacteroidota bacterium]
MKIKELLLKITPIKYYVTGKEFLNDPHYVDIQKKSNSEYSKSPSRTEIINFLLSLTKGDTSYLEIGVRNPDHNFNHIIADKKHSVDPGIAFKANPVDFTMTSDVFFQKLSKNEVLSNDIKFDVIFIDGLHLAEQVDRDIENALKYVKEDGFIVLHDCNPPSEWHAREQHNYRYTPARSFWNGTTWKAFLKWRCNASVYSCCVDSDWGVGILAKKHQIGNHIAELNPFFEFYMLAENREKLLNLIDFQTLKNRTRK